MRVSSLRNERLYRLLQREFGEVHVGKEGEPFVPSFVSSKMDGEVRIGDCDWGETYNVCCPCCGDRRFRLCFSHMTFEKVKGPEGLVKVKKWHCFNEGCETREDGELNGVIFRLDGPQRVFGRKDVKSALEVAVLEDKEIQMPAGSVPVLSLPKGHVALWYLLEKRGFREDDVRKLGFAWVERPGDSYPFNRLVCPLFVKGDDGPVLKGWQARFLKDDGTDTHDKKLGEVKWRSSPGIRKGSLLYNHANVANSIVTAVTEGPFDVAGGVGPEAGVALWGKAISRGQGNLLYRPWGGEDSVLVMALDGDAYVIEDYLTDQEKKAKRRSIESLLEFEASAKKTWSHAVRLAFRPEIDAGKTPRYVLWNEVYRMLRESGSARRIPAVAARVGVKDDNRSKDEQYFV